MAYQQDILAAARAKNLLPQNWRWDTDNGSELQGLYNEAMRQSGANEDGEGGDPNSPLRAFLREKGIASSYDASGRGVTLTNPQTGQLEHFYTGGKNNPAGNTVNIPGYGDLIPSAPYDAANRSSSSLWGAVKDFASNPGIQAMALGGIGSVLAGPGAAGGATTAAETGGSGLLNYGAGTTFNPSYGLTGTLGGGTGTAVAGAAADALAAGGAAPLAASTTPFSLASGVGGGLGGAATLGSALSPYTLAGAAGATSAATNLGGAAAGGGTGATGLGAGAGTGAAGAASALSRIMGGTATASDWMSILGSAGATALGVAGAKSQEGAYSDVADRFFAMGKPSLDRFEGSFAPGFNLAATDPAYAGALDVAGRTAANAVSAKSGNPYGNPGAMAEINKYILNSTALPQLNTYRSQNLTGAGLGTNVAGTAAIQGAGSEGGVYNALGFGLDRILNPKTDIEKLLAQFGGSTGFRPVIGGAQV